MVSTHVKGPGFALLSWAIAWAMMVLLEHKLDLANLAMLLVLASALSAL
jgi:two-component system, OmpR family, sensor histidine kinase KdpD